MNRLFQLLSAASRALSSYFYSDPERRALEAYLSQSTSVFDLEARQRRWDEQRVHQANLGLSLFRR